MLLCCLLLSLFRLSNGLARRESVNSFSSKERLSYKMILMKSWMSGYFSIPKILNVGFFGEIIDIWLHFSLFYLCKYYLPSPLLSLFLTELGSALYPSFIESCGLGGNPFIKDDVVKYSIFYLINIVLFLIIPLEFILYSIIFHGIFTAMVILATIRLQKRWRKISFDSDVISVTDLGFVNDS